MGISTCDIFSNIIVSLGLDNENIALINKLQIIHDSKNVNDWSFELIKLGRDKDLTIPNCLL